MKWPKPCRQDLFLALALLGAFNSELSTARAQNTVFTYQGRMMSGGIDFTGAGQFQFALVTSTNASHTATATANFSAPFVTGYNVTFGGGGYLAAPAVTISGGGGSGASATANLTGGVVTSLTPGSAGSGYTSIPTVTIAPPPPDITYSTYWSNDGTSVNGSEPAAAVPIGVTNGLFTVVLGDTTMANMEAISGVLFNQPGLQLRIWFNDGTSGFAVLNPAQNLTPAPYAIFANTASNVSGAVTSANLAGTYGNSVALTNANNSFNGSYAGNGGNMTNVNATKLGGLGAANFWQLGGNSVAPGQVLGSTNDQPVEFYAYGCKVLSLVPDSSGLGAPSVIGGSPANYVGAGIHGGTVSGGGTTNVEFAGYVFALPNSVTDDYGTVSGGCGNNASGYAATVSGGVNNTASGEGAFVGGGGLNQISRGNQASGEVSVVVGGSGNTAFGYGATVAGGYGNTANGDYSFAAGQQAQALHEGAFVWADSQSPSFSSTTNDQFNVRAGGGVRLVTSGAGLTLDGPQTGAGGLILDNTGTHGANPGTVISNALVFGTGPLGSGEGIASKRVGVNPYDLEFFTGFKNRMTINSSGNVGIATAEPTHLLVVNNAYCDGNQWYPSSDRNVKAGFESLSSQDVLAKVAGLPISRWHYTNDLATAHVGPMAQDFYAAFGIGPDDKHIGSSDEGGVALAAIQGLNQKVEEKEARIQEQAAEIAELKQRLDALEKMMTPQNRIERTTP